LARATREQDERIVHPLRTGRARDDHMKVDLTRIRVPPVLGDPNHTAPNVAGKAANSAWLEGHRGLSVKRWHANGPEDNGREHERDE
jgi:hypothetical protein